LRRAGLLPETNACCGIFLLCRAGGHLGNFFSFRYSIRMSLIGTYQININLINIFTFYPPPTTTLALPIGDDASNVMRLQSLRNYISRDKIYVNLRDSIRSYNHVRLQDIDGRSNVFALDHLLWSILGANVDSPGLICLVTMLLTKDHCITTGIADEEEGTISSSNGVVGGGGSSSNSGGGDSISSSSNNSRANTTDGRRKKNRKRHNNLFDDDDNDIFEEKGEKWKREYENGFDFDICVSDWIPNELLRIKFTTAATRIFERVDATHNEVTPPPLSIFLFPLLNAHLTFSFSFSSFLFTGNENDVNRFAIKIER
jgi:hypothetical protein